jgi:hypothetical protein
MGRLVRYRAAQDVDNFATSWSRQQAQGNGRWRGGVTWRLHSTAGSRVLIADRRRLAAPGEAEATAKFIRSIKKTGSPIPFLLRPMAGRSL